MINTITVVGDSTRLRLVRQDATVRCYRGAAASDHSLPGSAFISIGAQIHLWDSRECFPGFRAVELPRPVSAGHRMSVAMVAMAAPCHSSLERRERTIVCMTNLGGTE